MLSPRLVFSTSAWMAVPILLIGCGSGPAPSFTLSALPATVVIANSGPEQAITLGATAVNGFQGAINITLSGLPSGVTASPTTIHLVPGVLQQIQLSAVGSALATTPNVSIIGTAGGVSATLTASVEVTEAMTTAALSTESYHFGNNLVGNTLTKQVVTVMNTGTATLTMNPRIVGDAGFAIFSGTASKLCGSTLTAGANCNVMVSFDPGSATPSNLAATLNLGFGNVQTDTPRTVALTGTSAALNPGTVTATANPQVAQYSVVLPFPGSVSVSFGTDTTYGHSTWTQTTATAGTVTILVAGMLPLTSYHMQASISFANGIAATDVDQTFKTGDSLLHPQLVATTSAGFTPQSGVEQLTFLVGNTLGLAVTDLSGNVLWSYAVANPGTGNEVQGAKLLPNGHFLITLGQISNLALSSTVFPQGSIDSAREIDLAGNIIRQITTTDLTAELATAGYNLALEEFHHDITPLPNGHWLILANTLQSFDNLPGYPGSTSVLGDVIIDLDTNLQPVWVWNSFDHMDVNRHPYNFPDWTHANAITYSPSDGNILVSMRHQNWVLKLDYANGTGSGNIVWRLGEGGDFQLQGGTDPTDWFYAQHYPSLFSSNSSGIFQLGLMDNGDDRQFPTGVACGAPAMPPCLYTTIPVFQLNESTKVATLLFHQVLPQSLYSAWGGNTNLLANGHIEYDLAGESAGNSIVYEVTNSAVPQTVWQMSSPAAQAYRGYRLPSLYPGVQW